MKKLILSALGVLITILIWGQESKWPMQKSGVWRFENHLPEISYNLRNSTLSDSDNIAFKNNVANLSNWFYQNHAMLKNPRGYDLRAIAGWTWSDYTTKTEAEYGIPASLSFLFEVFDNEGGKWTIEPPQYEFEINSIYGAIAGGYFTPESIVDDGSRYPLSKSETVSAALAGMCSYFQVFPLKEQPCPGVNVYQIYPGKFMQKIVVFNPDRPPFWIPATVKEMAGVHMRYYELFDKLEIDRMIFEQLKQEIAELSEEELNAPAYYGHDSHFVLKVNGKRQGLQIMRFNPEYWDKTLPVSAIQIMTFWNPCNSEEEMKAQQERAYPDFPQLFVNQINWEKTANLIARKK